MSTGACPLYPLAFRSFHRFFTAFLLRPGSFSAILALGGLSIRVGAVSNSHVDIPGGGSGVGRGCRDLRIVYNAIFLRSPCFLFCTGEALGAGLDGVFCPSRQLLRNLGPLVAHHGLQVGDQMVLF